MAVSDSQRTMYLGISCDSNEEGQMVYWLEEALRIGVVENVRHKPYTVPVNDIVRYPGNYLECRKLKKCIKYLERTDRKMVAIAQQSYTPDISMDITDLGMILLGKHIAINKGRSWVVDVKGSFSGGLHNNSSLSFPFKQSMMYSMYGIIVQKVVPVKFFLKAWLPEKCRYTPVKKDLCKTFLKKDYPLIGDIEAAVAALIRDGIIDETTRQATPKLLDIWPGVKGAEYDRGCKEEDASCGEDQSKKGLF